LSYFDIVMPSRSVYVAGLARNYQFLFYLALFSADNMHSPEHA